MINFTKMQGLGNDFVVIDATYQAFELTTEQIHQLSDRHFGIGFDQLLVVEPPISHNADFKYRIFNADGSEVSQCGNGARCFARFVREKQLTLKDKIIVDTDSGQLILSFDDGELITVNMGIPRHAPKDIPLNVDQEAKFYSVTINHSEKAFGAVSMGNPHAVIQVNDIKTAPVLELGKDLEAHAIFPDRANIGFMQIQDRQHIKLRVYERGAGETLACGSGACAAVVIGIEQNLLDHQVWVELPGGSLKISWQGRGTAVMMTGPAVLLFDGCWVSGDYSEIDQLKAIEVEHYLQNHPDFFNEHLNLLEQLTIPHPSGNAVSLISKQLELFRSRHQELESQLTSLIEIARDNDNVCLRMHKLTLALLDASTLDEVIINLQLVLSEYFSTDFFSLRIITDHPVENCIADLFVQPGSEQLKPFVNELTRTHPSCGRPTLAQSRILFGEAALEVRSLAIVPMNFTQLDGFFAIGSRQDDRFHHSMGTLFLTQISELLGTRLISLLHR